MSYCIHKWCPVVQVVCTYNYYFYFKDFRQLLLLSTCNAVNIIWEFCIECGTDGNIILLHAAGMMYDWYTDLCRFIMAINYLDLYLHVIYYLFIHAALSYQRLWPTCGFYYFKEQLQDTAISLIRLQYSQWVVFVLYTICRLTVKLHISQTVV